MDKLIPDALLAWGQAHQGLLVALGAGSILMFAGTLVAVPIVICRLPHDIYVPAPRAARRGPAGLGVVLALARNLAGLAIIAAGILMLVLPGQGLLTIVIGIALVDFPGKSALERRLIGHRRVIDAMNAIRRRFGPPAPRPPRRASDLPGPKCPDTAHRRPPPLISPRSSHRVRPLPLHRLSPLPLPSHRARAQPA